MKYLALFAAIVACAYAQAYNAYNPYNNNPYNRGNYLNNQYNRYPYDNRVEDGRYNPYVNRGYPNYQGLFSTLPPSTVAPFKFTFSTTPAPVVTKPADDSKTSEEVKPTEVPEVPQFPFVGVNPVPVASVPKVFQNIRVANDPNAQIVRYENDILPNGGYQYVYETDNGIAAQEIGQPKNFGGNPPNIPNVAQGSFQWTSPEGQVVAISYEADENGYRAVGDAIPTPPPIPEAILRALAYIEAKERSIPVPVALGSVFSAEKKSLEETKSE